MGDGCMPATNVRGLPVFIFLCTGIAFSIGYGAFCVSMHVNKRAALTVANVPSLLYQSTLLQLHSALAPLSGEGTTAWTRDRTTEPMYSWM